MFSRLWRQRRIIVLTCLTAFLVSFIEPRVLDPLALVMPDGNASAATFVAIVFAFSLLVSHLAPSWRWIPFSLVVGYGVSVWACWILTPRFAEVLPKEILDTDTEGAVVGPGVVTIIVLTFVFAWVLRMLGGLLNTIRRSAPRETVVGGVIRRPRDELWALMKPEITREHWHPEVQMVERDRMNPKLSHVIHWRKFGNDFARRVRTIEDEVPGVQFREVIADDGRSTLTSGMSGSTGWLLEDDPKGTFLTMREEVAGLGLMTPIWRWFDDYERDYLVFLRAHLEGGRDWSLHGLDIVEGEE